MFTRTVVCQPKKVDRLTRTNVCITRNREIVGKLHNTAQQNRGGGGNNTNLKNRGEILKKLLNSNFIWYN